MRRRFQNGPLFVAFGQKRNTIRLHVTESFTQLIEARQNVKYWGPQLPSQGRDCIASYLKRQNINAYHLILGEAFCLRSREKSLRLLLVVCIVKNLSSS